jgi:hypothetical protein
MLTPKFQASFATYSTRLKSEVSDPGLDRPGHFMNRAVLLITAQDSFYFIFNKNHNIYIYILCSSLNGSVINCKTEVGLCSFSVGPEKGVGPDIT